MKSFSTIISESNNDNILDVKDLELYLYKFGNKLTKYEKLVIELCIKYSITSQNMLEAFRCGKVNKQLLDELHIDKNALKNFESALQAIKNLKVLPHFMSEYEFKSVLNGNMKFEDAILDLDSDHGRNEVAKQFMPLVYKIVNQFIGKSSLGKSDLISAGLTGLTKAMNDFKKDGVEGVDSENISDAKKNKQSFQQYAAWRIRYQILDDINEYSRTVKASAYLSKKAQEEGSSTYSVSIDHKADDKEMQSQIDRIGLLGEDPDFEDGVERSEENNIKQWKRLFDLLAKKFNGRDCNIFYRYFGLNDYKKEKGKDIAKDLGVSPAKITVTVNKMIDLLKRDAEAKLLLLDLCEIYTESLMKEIYYKSKSEIIEAFINDETYILLESLTKMNNKTVFKKALDGGFAGLSDKEWLVIYNCLDKGFEWMDANFRKNKNTILMFLEKFDPSEPYYNKSDVEILDAMSDIIDLYHKHGIKL